MNAQPTGGVVLGAVVREWRPGQWTKNLVVLAGVIFAHQFVVGAQLARAVAAMAAFCLLSSGSYVFNDLLDLERDRLHPVKRLRPLASGRIPRAAGWVMAVAPAAAGLALAFAVTRDLGLVAAGYLVLQLAYTLVLKRWVLVDVMAIAIGFVLRAVAGIEALRPQPQLSPWLLVCTFFLALFLAVAKRRHERVTLAADAQQHRSTLAQYPPALLDQLMPVVTATTIIGYAIYTISPATTEHVPSGHMVLTIPFVVYGVFRYLYLVYHAGRGGAPAELLIKDLPLLVNVALWGLAILIILGIG
jgi:4-hydroxybenzoate polyprenyltransferase